MLAQEVMFLFGEAAYPIVTKELPADPPAHLV